MKKDNTSLNIWNNSFWDQNYKSIHLIFKVLLNNKKYIFFVSIKSGKNFSYEFARNKKTNHSLRKYHTRKKSCTYDQHTCTKLVEIVKKTSKK